MQSISVFLDITKFANFRWINADVLFAARPPPICEQPQKYPSSIRLTVANLEILANSLRNVNLTWHCYLEIDWRCESVAKKVLWLLTSFTWYVSGMSLELLDHTNIHCCRNASEKVPQHFIIIAQEWEVSYLLKSNFKWNLQKHHFAYVYEVIIKCYPNFITCKYILPLL